MKINRIVFLSVALFLTAQAGVQDGSNITLDEIAHRSELIVAASVVDQYSAWDELGREIYTYTTLQIDRSVRNPNGQKQIQMRHLGGKVGEFESHVEGLPQFELDQRIVVFLGPYPQSEYYGLIDWSKGVYRITGEGENAQVFGAGVDSESLDTFMKKVAEAIK